MKRRKSPGLLPALEALLEDARKESDRSERDKKEDPQNPGLQWDCGYWYGRKHALEAAIAAVEKALY